MYPIVPTPTPLLQSQVPPVTQGKVRMIRGYRRLPDSMDFETVGAAPARTWRGRWLCQPVWVQQDIHWWQKSTVWAELTAVLLVRILGWVLLTVQAGLELGLLGP